MGALLFFLDQIKQKESKMPCNFNHLSQRNVFIIHSCFMLLFLNSVLTKRLLIENFSNHNRKRLLSSDKSSTRKKEKQENKNTKTQDKNYRKYIEINGRDLSGRSMTGMML